MNTERLPRDVYRSLVGFLVGGIQYAVPTLAVRAVSAPGEIVELPHLPHGVAGVVEHRGQVIPLIDLRVCFALEDSERVGRCQWLVLESEGHQIGLVATRVTGVFDVGFGGLRPVPDLGRTVDPRNLVGVTSRDDELVFVLDVQAFRNYTLEVPLPQLERA